MAYNQQNLYLAFAAPGIPRQKLWFYVSADSFATVKVANYISNGFDMGVRERDEIHIIDTATPETTIANVLTCTASACTISQTGVVIAE
ncbi:MAG TPA: hypothetical protein VEK82_14850 [Stellaceae bacterium]|nr:hypothetical protein [Stellaceae bacterium]